MDLLFQIRDSLESIIEKSDDICERLGDIDSGITSIDGSEELGDIRDVLFETIGKDTECKRRFKRQQ
jgi:hypothetical protein